MCGEKDSFVEADQKRRPLHVLREQSGDGRTGGDIRKDRLYLPYCVEEGAAFSV